MMFVSLTHNWTNKILLEENKVPLKLKYNTWVNIEVNYHSDLDIFR